MELRSSSFVLLVVLGLLSSMRLAVGIRFIIELGECFGHFIPEAGDRVHVSFVIVKAETSWRTAHEGVDLVVKNPSGKQIQDIRDKASGKFDFVAEEKGLHRFCFTNKSPYLETIDFDVFVGHTPHAPKHATNGHLSSLSEQIGKLEDDLMNINFEQHWLEAQSDRQARVTEAMRKKTIHKALIESAALVGASVLQVFLLQRLFERKLGTSRT